MYRFIYITVYTIYRTCYRANNKLGAKEYISTLYVCNFSTDLCIN